MKTTKEMTLVSIDKLIPYTTPEHIARPRLRNFAQASANSASSIQSL